MRFLPLSLTFLLGCSSIKMVSKTGNTPTDSGTSIQLLSQFDSIPKKSVLLGSFKLVENKDGRWTSVYNKIKTLASQNNANTIKIDEYHMNGGYGTRGNLGLVLGRLYSQSSEAMKQRQVKSDSIFLFVMRYEKDRVVSKPFNVDLYKNEQLVGSLPNRSAHKILVRVGDHIRLSTEKNQNEIFVDVNEHTDYYVKVFKEIETSRSSDTKSVLFSFGDVRFVPVDPTLGKLEYENILQLNSPKK